MLRYIFVAHPIFCPFRTICDSSWRLLKDVILCSRPMREGSLLRNEKAPPERGNRNWSDYFDRVKPSSVCAEITGDEIGVVPLSDKLLIPDGFFTEMRGQYVGTEDRDRQRQNRGTHDCGGENCQPNDTGINNQFYRRRLLRPISSRSLARPREDGSLETQTRFRICSYSCFSLNAGS